MSRLTRALSAIFTIGALAAVSPPACVRPTQERAERDMRETTALVSQLLTDRAACVEFHEEAAALVGEIVRHASDGSATTRRARALRLSR